MNRLLKFVPLVIVCLYPSIAMARPGLDEMSDGELLGSLIIIYAPPIILFILIIVIATLALLRLLDNCDKDRKTTESID